MSEFGIKRRVGTQRCWARVGSAQPSGSTDQSKTNLNNAGRQSYFMQKIEYELKRRPMEHVSVKMLRTSEARALERHNCMAVVALSYGVR